MNKRYGFVVITGRYKILDYFKADGQQIATADSEEAARLIVRALNADSEADKMRAAQEALSLTRESLAQQESE